MWGVKVNIGILGNKIVGFVVVLERLWNFVDNLCRVVIRCNRFFFVFLGVIIYRIL